MAKQAQLAKTLVELADTLVADFDVVDLLALLAERCVEVLDVGAAGLMLAGPDGMLHVIASSSEAMRVLELFEIQSDEGPCLDCYRTGEPVIHQVLESGVGRWPRFASEAIEAGFNSVDALPMRLRGSVIGALNLFSADVGRLRSEDVHVVQALADVATIGLLQERAIHRGEVLAEQLQRALNSRVVIEQAKGAIAQMEGSTPEEAFEVLRSQARASRRRLVDVAAAVLDRIDVRH